MNIVEKSKLMHEKRIKFITEYLNPHENEMKDFIKEVIAEYNIKINEDWIKHRDLVPDCASKSLWEFHFQKLDNSK